MKSKHKCKPLPEKGSEEYRCRAKRFTWEPKDLIVFKSEEEYQKYCETHPVIKYYESN